MTVMKKNAFMKLFKSTVALLMVMAMCCLVFAGCAPNGDGKDKENNGKDTPNYDKMTPLEHFAALELNNANGMVDALSAVYGALAQPASKANYGAEVDISLQVGDVVQDVLEESYFEASGEKMDFSFLSKVNLEVDLNVKNKMQQMDMAVGLGGSRILTICTIMDLDDFTTWVGSPELSDVFAEMNLVQSGGVAVNSATMQTANALIEALPSEQEFNALVKRYLEVALEKVDDVERKTITLELDGLKQECTVLVVKIYEEDALNIAEAVLKTAKTDNELKAIIEKFGVAFNDLMKESYTQAGGTWTNVDLYAEFITAVEDALTSLEMEREDLDTEEYIELTAYVDKEHNIIGRKLALDGDELHYYTVTEGNAFTFEASLDEVKVTGGGTKKSGKVDGSFKLSMEGTSLLTLAVEGWSASEKETKGTLVLEPSAELIQQIGGNSGALPFADIALELKIDSSESKNDFEMNLLSNETLVVGIAMSAKTSSGSDIQKPTETIDFTNQYQLQSWVQSMDFNKLFQNMRNAGVPGELVDMLEASLFG